MKKSFVLYTDIEQFVDNMNNEQAGELFRAILNHETGKDVVLKDAIVKTVFPFIKTKLDEASVKYDRKRKQNSKNASKRWDATVSDSMRPHATASEPMPTDTVTVTVTDTVKKKKKETIVLPDFIDNETWDSFLSMRKTIKKPMMPLAVTRMINKLTSFHDKGHNVNEVLILSISNNWLDVYEPKQKEEQNNWDKKWN